MKTIEQHAADVTESFFQQVGNRGGWPKWKSIRKRWTNGKTVHEAEIEWARAFERANNIHCPWEAR